MNRAAQSLGRLGGKAGTGAAKARTSEQARAAVAALLNRPLSIDESILDTLRQRFLARGFRMAKINEKQAEVIEGAEILENPFGTAPGMWIEEKGRYIVLLPGPPRELQAVFEQSVLPKVRQLGGGMRLAYRSFHATVITES